MKLNEAIEVLKDLKRLSTIPMTLREGIDTILLNKAIDTVVAEVEGRNNQIPCDCLNRREIWERYECVNCGKLHIDKEL